MRVMTVNEFARKSRRYLNGREDVVVTRRGKPLAVVTPVGAKSPVQPLREMGQILRASGITKRAALNMLEESRAAVYR